MGPVRRTAISLTSCETSCGELGRATRGTVHRVNHFDDVMLGFFEAAAPLHSVVVVEPNH